MIAVKNLKRNMHQNHNHDRASEMKFEIDLTLLLSIQKVHDSKHDFFGIEKFIPSWCQTICKNTLCITKALGFFHCAQAK